jgi:hypothetical protein
MCEWSALMCSATPLRPAVCWRRPQELVFDPFFTVRQVLRIQSGYFGFRQNDPWIDELLHNLGLTAQADKNMELCPAA